MRSTRLGSSGLEVSVLGLGLAALGRPGYINLGHGEDVRERRDPAALEAHTHAVLDAAWGAGIRYFDVARSYGRAEDFLGNWLRARAIAPGDVVVGSKWGYTYTADWQVDAAVHEVKEHTVAMLDRQLHESRARLGEYLRLYQIHSATVESGVLEQQAILARLATLRDQGTAVGLTTSGPRQVDTIERALDVAPGGDLLFGTVQTTWNLLEPSAEGALLAASEAGLGVIIKEAVANGRLTDRSPAEAGRLRAVSRGFSVDALALAAALALPWKHLVLSGAATVDQLQSNVAALGVPDQVLAGLPDMAQPPRSYWAERASLPWT